jgi:hypothetical protein
MLGGVFAAAGVARLRDPAGSRRAVEDFGAPARVARRVALLLPRCWRRRKTGFSLVV